MVRRSCWRPLYAGGLVMVLGVSSAAAQPRSLPRAPVRVTYDAPPGCPTTEAFLSLVRTRVGTDWEAPRDVLASTIEVRVSGTESQKIARIDFIDDHGQKFTRTLSATTCDEVVSGIALITALAIESRVAEAFAPDEPAAQSAPAPPSLKASPAPAAPRLQAIVPAPNSEVPARPRPSPASSRTVHIDVGAAGWIGSGVGPALGRGFRGFMGLGWNRGPDVRLGVDSVSTPTIDRDGVPTLFSLLGARASGCPIAIPLGARYRMLPCAGAEAGLHRGIGHGSSGTVKAGEAAPFFLTPFVSFRVEGAWDALFTEIEGDAQFPLDHRQFDFNTTPVEHAYQVPAAAFGLSFGIGLRL